MARLARVVLPGYPHHITQRGNRRQDVFFQDEDYLSFLNWRGYLTNAARWVELSPSNIVRVQHRPGIFGDHIVSGEECESFDSGLCNEHAIERVFVQGGQ